MGIALHPYIVGQPYRLRHLRRALQHIAAGATGGVWFTTPGHLRHATRAASDDASAARRSPLSNPTTVARNARPAAWAVRGPAVTGGRGRERIYRAVFDSVMSQRLTPGTKLPEASLCELFGVSRSVVRKVLQRLAHDHIVQLRPNRGAIVAVPTPEETRQIFEARRALEAAIVDSLRSTPPPPTCAPCGSN